MSVNTEFTVVAVSGPGGRSTGGTGGTGGGDIANCRALQDDAQLANSGDILEKFLGGGIDGGIGGFGGGGESGFRSSGDDPMTGDEGLSNDTTDGSCRDVDEC